MKLDTMIATLYNKNGEGNTWTGIIKQYLSSDMLLIGKAFWDLILPNGISFKDFSKMYSEVSTELKINQILTDLIKEVNAQPKQSSLL